MRWIITNLRNKEMEVNMKKVFWENPYQKKLETKVASVVDDRILFEETIAFSFSGGQESDRSLINGRPMLDSEIEGNLIFYILETGHGLRPTDSVVMEIDWMRYGVMRLQLCS